jgi:type I restriction enzyme M protein
MYELWELAQTGNAIDKGVLFLENAYRVLEENGRLGIILSNSIASIDAWEEVRKWLLKKMRVVALFDLPPNVFADTGVTTTLIVAYKPNKKELEKLQSQNYEVFIRDINNVGYEIKTIDRVKTYKPIYKIDEENFEVMMDEEGNPLCDEDFSKTIADFKEWAKTQETKLKKDFL